MKLKMKYLMILILLFSLISNCGKSKSNRTKFSIVPIALLGGIETGEAKKINAVGNPTVTLPNTSTVTDETIATITESRIPIPNSIDEQWIPIGKPVEIGPENKTVTFETGKYAEIKFVYDADTIAANNLEEEFNVFFYDVIGKQWKPVDMVDFDTNTKTITAYTSHFTTFIATASSTRAGRATPPPACITSSYPEGISGFGKAEFITLGENTKYYKDRDYLIKPISKSVENKKTFEAFGFQGALGVSTCNGNDKNLNNCSTMRNEKQNTGLNYVSFKAHTNIDVYLMYDRRATKTLTDTSRDASWLSANGFTFTGRYVETTDAVRYYRVYKKSYSKGEQVLLHGNRNGTTSTAINTNYWLAIKRRGVTTTESASALCESGTIVEDGKLEVRQESVIITSGVNFDLGNIFKNTKKYISFEIKNIGTTPLKFTNPPKLIGIDKSEFKILEQVPSSIEVGATQLVTIEHTAIREQEDAKSASLILETNDKTQNSFSINLSARSIFNYSVNRLHIFQHNSITPFPPKTPFSDPTGISYSISPNLVSELVLDSTTGIISGTSDDILIGTEFTITGTNGTDSMSFKIKLAISGWEKVGDKIPFTGGSFSQLVISNNQPFVLMYDSSKVYDSNINQYIDKGLVLKKLENNSWVQVGNKINTSNFSGTNKLVISNNQPYVLIYESGKVYDSNINQYIDKGLFLKKLENNSWVQVGNKINTSSFFDPTFSGSYELVVSNNQPFVLMYEPGSVYDSNIDQYIDQGLFLKKLENNSWVQVGDKINSSNFSGTYKLVISNNQPFVLMYESGKVYDSNINQYIDKGLFLKKLENNSWVQVGNKINSSTSFQPSNSGTYELTFSNNQPYVLMYEPGVGLVLKKLESNSWVQVGNKINYSTSFQPHFSGTYELAFSNNQPFVLMYEHGNYDSNIDQYIDQGLFLKKLENNSWVQFEARINNSTYFDPLYANYNLGILNNQPYVLIFQSGKIYDSNTNQYIDKGLFFKKFIDNSNF